MNAKSLEAVSLEEQEGLREEVRQIMAREGLTLTDVSRETGIAFSTFSAWQNNSYKGDTSDKARSVQKWLETRRERRRTSSILPTPPAFQQTQTAAEIFAIMSFAQAAPDFGVVVGAPGIGKSIVIEEYQKQYSNVFVVTGEPILSSPNNLLVALAEEVGVLERRNTYLSRAIRAKLRSASALVVIDEAQHLSSQALDQLRTTVLDLAKTGVVVAGNETLLARLQGSADARAAQFAQLHSRVGMRTVQSHPRAKDICILIDAWGIEDSGARDLLKLIARKPGALRSMTKAIRLATMLAGEEGAALTAKHVQRAWSQLSASTLEASA